MRARNIKPDYYRDVELEECSIPARWIFPALWMMADREGRLKDNPKQIKREICPLDKVDIDKLLNELVGVGVIIRYMVDGKKYIQVNNFKKHQNPHRNEPDSVIPEPPETLPEDSGNDASAPADSCFLNPDSLIPDSCNTASGDAGQVYVSKKGRKLRGTCLADFDLFWERFDYKKGRAEAADAWLDLKPDHALTGKILEGATREATNRPKLIEKGTTPKMAQGWLSARRWEDDYSLQSQGESIFDRRRRERQEQ